MTKLPQVNVDADDLIALARWKHYQEVPDGERLERLMARNVATPVMTSVGGANPQVGPPMIWDRDVRDQVERIPDYWEWVTYVFSNLDEDQAQPSSEALRFTKLALTTDRRADPPRQRFVVVIGTTPSRDGKGFTAHQVADDEDLPWMLDFESSQPSWGRGPQV